VDEVCPTKLTSSLEITLGANYFLVIYLGDLVSEVGR